MEWKCATLTSRILQSLPDQLQGTSMIKSSQNGREAVTTFATSKTSTRAQAVKMVCILFSLHIVLIKERK
jgi:hypothetical protein